MEDERVHDRIWEMGRVLMDGLRQVGSESGLPFRVQGPGPMFHTGFTERHAAMEYRDLFDDDTALGAAFVRGLHRRGVRVLSRGLWYLSSAHTDADLQVAIEAARATLAELAAERTPA
jgi:glutamate-1-semialdehyde 2,1-aminomutase